MNLMEELSVLSYGAQYVGENEKYDKLVKKLKHVAGKGFNKVIVRLDLSSEIRQRLRNEGLMVYIVGNNDTHIEWGNSEQSIRVVEFKTLDM